MKGSHVLDFLKAPFNQQFVFVCLLLLPVLLLAPLFTSFFNFLYQNLDFVQSADDEMVGRLFIQWFITQKAQLYIFAFLGLFMSGFLIQSYSLILIHGIQSQKVKLYDFKMLPIANSQIFKGILKLISYTFWLACYFVICSIAAILFIGLIKFLAEILPTFFSVLLWIACVLVCIAFILWIILNSTVASYRFYMNLKTRTIFEWFENYRFIKKYKSRFFIVFGICFLFAQVISVISQTVYTWILQFFSLIEGLIISFGASQPIMPSILMILLGIIFFAYLTLLHSIFIGKALFWLKQKPKTKKK